MINKIKIECTDLQWKNLSKVLERRVCCIKAVTCLPDKECSECFNEVFERVEPPKPKRWRAAEGEIYWLVNMFVRVDSNVDRRSESHDSLFKTGNYFRTVEQAEQYAEKVRDVFEQAKGEYIE
jgi:hypothetical protein